MSQMFKLESLHLCVPEFQKPLLLRNVCVALMQFCCFPFIQSNHCPAEHTECFVELKEEEKKKLNNVDRQAPMCHIVTLSQSQLKEFRQTACVCPGPAPGARHVTSQQQQQQQDTPLARTGKQTRPCLRLSAEKVGLLQLELQFYSLTMGNDCVL